MPRNAANEHLIDPKKLRELFTYCHHTGELRNKTARHLAPIGAIAGCSRGVSIDNMLLIRSRVIWAWYTGRWPKGQIDHINRIHSDDRIVNLRECTVNENNYNTVRANPYGLKGVTWRDRKKKPWLAKIRVDGVRINLGSFATKEEAAKAYEDACLKYHGAFAQLGTK
jgi:hypothetical protein